MPSNIACRTKSAPRRNYILTNYIPIDHQEHNKKNAATPAQASLTLRVSVSVSIPSATLTRSVSEARISRHHEETRRITNTRPRPTSLEFEQEETEKTERAFFLRFLCFLLLKSRRPRERRAGRPRIRKNRAGLTGRGRRTCERPSGHRSENFRGLRDFGSFPSAVQLYILAMPSFLGNIHKRGDPKRDSAEIKA